MDVLIISNGNAEDLFGATLASYLNDLKVAALPLVGEGRSYEGKVEAILGPRRSMPSGGFPFNSPENLWADLRAGFLPMSLAQWRAAQQVGKGAKVTLVVGDAYALWVAVWFGGRRQLFHLNPLISAHYAESKSLSNLNEWGASDFTPFERTLQRWARAVFVRDALSEERIRALGIAHARYLGSFAMDVLPPPTHLEFDLTAPVLALLPGSRADVGFSLPLMLEASTQLPELQAVVAWSPPLDQIPLPTGWEFEARGPNWGVAHHQGHQVWVVRERFSEILHAATLVLGCAGTGNEQAAGLGKPIVGFPTPGPQFTLGFARRQRQLLGEALCLVEAEPQAVAAEVRAILADPERARRMGSVGRSRIGEAGALPQIAQIIRGSVQASS